MGGIWWRLCCTGMIPNDFFAGEWRVEDDRSHILGRKRAARDRYVPRVVDVTPKTLLAVLENVDTSGDTEKGETRVTLSAPRRSRTPSLLVRSQTLYPVELWARHRRRTVP